MKQPPGARHLQQYFHFVAGKSEFGGEISVSLGGHDVGAIHESPVPHRIYMMTVSDNERAIRESPLQNRAGFYAAKFRFVSDISPTPSAVGASRKRQQSVLKLRPPKFRLDHKQSYLSDSRGESPERGAAL